MTHEGSLLRRTCTDCTYTLGATGREASNLSVNRLFLDKAFDRGTRVGARSM